MAVINDGSLHSYLCKAIQDTLGETTMEKAPFGGMKPVNV